MSAVSLEILEFIRPEGNNKNLYITGIPWMEEAEILDKFYQLFTTYGPVYGIRLCPASIKISRPVSEPDTPPFNCRVGIALNDTDKDKSTPPGGNNEQNGYYAFVTFYLAMSAKRAKDNLKSRLIIQGNECKISTAKRKKEISRATLHFTKCQELANQYLGFNGWSTSVKLLECDSEVQEGEIKKLQYVCVVRLNIAQHGLSTDGLGAWEESCLTTDPTSRAKAICKAKKLSYQRAVEDAFSRVLLIVLNNGKVSVEIDTTRPDALLAQKQVNMEPVLKVNELDKEPEEEQIDMSFNDIDDIDDINLHILHQLEEEM
ncbi:RAD52 motif-containing protein 1-like [Mizuhopecten yessoensis]|uniref:RAD52 motif-containing protein 1 n=1 Tax=Mizuhopecten yessoensis TaxID=6573 RepID=A0A210QLA2_MIZYE|nr:RAD52 motif-containing protein 1-like [Mizuhopecten yessoensis]OWF49510.1 RAD52 motif-containing protein 1 [Mizuhopecten yessoensis]